MKPGFFKSSPCGVASLIITLPFILGVAFGLVAFLAAWLKLLGSDTFYVIFMVGSIAFMFWFTIVLVCSLAGVILAVVSFFRREPRPLMGVLGLILNGCPLILMILVLFQHRLF
jgi:hypothetical protein